VILRPDFYLMHSHMLIWKFISRCRITLSFKFSQLWSYWTQTSVSPLAWILRVVCSDTELPLLLLILVHPVLDSRIADGCERINEAFVGSLSFESSANNFLIVCKFLLSLLQNFNLHGISIPPCSKSYEYLLVPVTTHDMAPPLHVA